MNPTTGPTRRWGAVALATVAAVAALGTACVPETPPPTTAPPTAVQVSLDKAGDWVLSQYNAENVMESEFAPGVQDHGNSVLGIANLAAIDEDPANDQARLDALEVDLEDLYLSDGLTPASDRPGALARVIMAVVATGGDPRDFLGTDLVARLEATLQPSGLFGVQSASFDGSFRQGLALAALSLVTPRPASITPGPGETVDDLPAVAWLRDQQCDDGSWLMLTDPSAGDCVENPAAWTYKDSNGSALAILGLEAVGATFPVDPSTWLESVRGDDGGWGTSPAGPTQTSDADSTGLVIGALEALGETLDAAAYDKLLDFQFDETAPPADQGAFYWRSDWVAPNRLATMDAMVALFDEVWPGALAP
jgi:hypothetical protein